MQLPWPVAWGLSATSAAAAALPTMWEMLTRATRGVPLLGGTWRTSVVRVSVWVLLCMVMGWARSRPTDGLPVQIAVQQKQGGETVDHAFDLVWAGECRRGGHVSVARAWLMGHYQYQLLKYDHSLLGGVFVHPENVSGQSIYGAFYLQVCCVLV